MAVTLTLDDEIDVSRGDMLVGIQAHPPIVADKFTANIVWMTEQPLAPGRQYIIKLGTRSVSGSVSIIHHRIDVNTLEHHDATVLQLNEIGSCTVAVNAPVVFDAYKQNKGSGAFIIIDRLTNGTVGAGMITGASHDINQQFVSVEERAARFGQIPAAVSLTGVASQTIAYQLERKLFDNGHVVTVLEMPELTLIAAIKGAGLIAIIVNSSVDIADVVFDTDLQSLEDIYTALLAQQIIY